MLKRLFCSLFFVFVGVVMGFAQQIPTTQGTEFWVSFMRNGYRNSTAPNPQKEKLIMIASAKRGCTVTVRNPNQNWEDSFTVGNNGVATFLVPDTRGYNDQYGKSYKGLLVTSTDTISLYVANEAENSYDASNVLPVNALGCQYMIQSNKSIGEQTSHPNENRASFLIIAIEDDTQVRIIPTCETWDNHAAGNPYTITLQAGECYHILNKNQGATYNTEGDFSGTMIESLNEKPIAVFNGNCITSIPGGTTSGFDHVFEQAMPIDHWGKRFVVTSTYAPADFNLLNDQVKITALYNNTTVWRDGVELPQKLDAGESYSFEMNLNTEPCSYLLADNPIAVYLYNHSHRQGSGTTYGDPSMVWISPVEQTIREITFSTFQASNGLSHFVNVVCYTESVDELTFDNNHISSFTVVPSAPEFSYARLNNVTAGAHTIRCPGGFVAHVYGIGPNEGYAYTVGSSAKVLTNQLFVNDDLVLEAYTTCQSEMLQFRLETNYEPEFVKWNFGDGSPVIQGTEVSHTYDVAGDYVVEVEVKHEVNGEPQSDILSTTIHVNPQIEIEWVDSTCNPIYYFHGKDFQVPYFGDVLFPNDEGCDTIYHMNITEGSSMSFVRCDTACMEYEWFDTIRYESGTYLVILNQPGGCDSLYILHLTIGQPPEHPVRYKSSCSSYNWDNRVICETTGTYRLEFETAEHCVYDSILYFTRVPAEDFIYEKDTCDQYQWQGRVYKEIGTHTYDTVIMGDNGCESHHTLHLTLHASPPFERIMGLTQVAVATTFWPGQYIYHLDDSTGMDTSRIQWELLDNPAGPEQWELIPHGASCTIVSYSMGKRVLWVSTGNDLCDKEAYLTINCTNYGVDENEIVGLEVYPNPTKGELVVKGPEMLEITIYNLLGQKMRSVAANGNTEVKMNVEGVPQALYLLEVRTERGNKTRLVSVIN